MATEFNTQVGNGKYCLQFETDNKKHYLLMQSAARRCIDRAHMTNADRIRAMSDEELADMMTVMNGCFTCHECFENNGGRCNADCVKNCFNWLKQPAE